MELARLIRVTTIAGCLIGPAYADDIPPPISGLTCDNAIDRLATLDILVASDQRTFARLLSKLEADIETQRVAFANLLSEAAVLSLYLDVGDWALFHHCLSDAGKSKWSKERTASAKLLRDDEDLAASIGSGIDARERK